MPKTTKTPAAPGTKPLADTIEKALKGDKTLWTDDGVLNQTLVIDRVEKHDTEVVGLLFKNKKLRDEFFAEGDCFCVFKTDEFRRFLQKSQLDNSWTDYKNQIGLTVGKRFIKDSNDVVLSFPFKDCVLAGGQKTDDGKEPCYAFDKNGNYKKNEKGEKRQEIFFNEVLNADERDRLLDEKALVGWKRYCTATSPPPLSLQGSYRKSQRFSPR